MGALLTFILASVGLFWVLPGVWLLLYGTAIVTRAAPFPCAPFRSWACASSRWVWSRFFAPIAWQNILMAAGFRGRPHRFWYLDRQALRRLNQGFMAKSSPIRQEGASRARDARDTDALLPAKVPRKFCGRAVRGSRRRSRSRRPPTSTRLIHERIRLGIVSALAVNRLPHLQRIESLAEKPPTAT